MTFENEDRQPIAETQDLEKLEFLPGESEPPAEEVTAYQLIFSTESAGAALEEPPVSFNPGVSFDHDRINVHESGNLPDLGEIDVAGYLDLDAPMPFELVGRSLLADDAVVDEAQPELEFDDPDDDLEF